MTDNTLSSPNFSVAFVPMMIDTVLTRETVNITRQTSGYAPSSAANNCITHASRVIQSNDWIYQAGSRLRSRKYKHHEKSASVWSEFLMPLFSIINLHLLRWAYKSSLTIYRGCQKLTSEDNVRSVVKSLLKSQPYKPSPTDGCPNESIIWSSV